MYMPKRNEEKIREIQRNMQRTGKNKVRKFNLNVRGKIVKSTQLI